MSSMNIPQEFDKIIRNLPLKERIKKLEHVFKTSDDESERWDAVWIAGEIPVEVNLKGPLFEKMVDLFAWVLKNDPNDVVRHEVSLSILLQAWRLAAGSPAGDGPKPWVG